MFSRFSGKFYLTVDVVVIKNDTFAVSYEEKVSNTISKMVFTISVYSINKREDVFYP